jgi:hypothetical protein
LSSQEIIINALPLSDEQIELWKQVYEEASLERAYFEKRDLLFVDTTWEINNGPFLLLLQMLKICLYIDHFSSFCRKKHFRQVFCGRSA